MNKQDRKTADRLKSALDNLGATPKRTQVYDLIAAARGLRNRELLKQPYLMPTEADLVMLQPVATRIDADLAETIVASAAAVAVPTPLVCEIHTGWKGASFEITFDELSDPDAFLSGPRGQAAIKVIARNIYHTAFYLDRSDGGLDLKQGNELAGKILGAQDTGDHYDALEEFYGEARSAHDSLSEQEDELDTAIQALEGLANDIGADFDEHEWRDPLRDAIVEHLEEDDDSNVEDMIQSSDRAEILFLFAPRDKYLSDAMVTTEYNSNSSKDVNIDHALQFALSRLGYSIGEYRRFTGNEREARDDLDPSLVPLPRALVTPGELMTVIDNAGDSYFHLGLYVQVPISEILTLDKDKPIVLRNVHLCAHGPINGTHFDGRVLEEVIVSPEDGVLIAASTSPSDLCGYVNSYFHGGAKNVEEPEDEQGEVVAMSFDGGDQYRMAFAA